MPAYANLGLGIWLVWQTFRFKVFNYIKHLSAKDRIPNPGAACSNRAGGHHYFLITRFLSRAGFSLCVSV